MITRLFGTDGIRGTTGCNHSGERQVRLTPDLALRIGYAAGQLVRDRLAGDTRGCAVVGSDPRISSAMLESSLTAGLLAQGVDVVQVGMLPTPAIAFLTRHAGAHLGIVISASHNPVDDNGIKFFDPAGYKLDDEMEQHIESLVVNPDRTFEPRNTRELGRLQTNAAWPQVYVDYLVHSRCGDLAGLHVLLECANGATSCVAPEVFRRLGARVETVNGHPDGLNINESYEYVEPARFGQLVVEKGAHLGVTFDGDGDRTILVDERGQVVDGDAILAILAREMLAQERLPGRVVVATQMSNFGLHDSLRQVGVEVVETQVGDKFVLREMLARGCTLGGERSGHILILDQGQTTGDGIYTALAVLTALIRRGDRRLSELAAAMPRYPQFIESVPIPPARPPLDQMAPVQTVLERLRERLGPRVDINLRYSGTEDKLRLSVRGWGDSDPEQLDREARAALQESARLIAAAT